MPKTRADFYEARGGWRFANANSINLTVVKVETVNNILKNHSSLSF